MAAAKPLSAQIANAFVEEYYFLLCNNPDQVCKFYEDISKLTRPEKDGSMSITTTKDAINKKIVSLRYDIHHGFLRSVDAHESFRGGLDILVTGHMFGDSFIVRNFAQTFFLAPQDSDRGYFVLSDVFRYVRAGSTQDITARKPVSVVSKLGYLLGHVLFFKKFVSEKSHGSIDPLKVATQPLSAQVARAFVDEYYDKLNNCPNQITMFYDDMSKLCREEKDGSMCITTTKYAISKKIASISSADFRAVTRSVDAQESLEGGVHVLVIGCLYGEDFPAIHFAQTFFLAPQDSTRGYFILNDVFRYVNGEIAMGKDRVGPYSPGGYSIFIYDLPWNANAALLHEAFKKFGPIKNGGIQVFGRKGSCAGIVEFEGESAVQEALKASPVSIGGQRCKVSLGDKAARPSKERDGRDPFWMLGYFLCVLVMFLAIVNYVSTLSDRDLDLDLCTGPTCT